MFIEIEDYWNTLKSKRINTENIAFYEPIDGSQNDSFEYTIKIRFKNKMDDYNGGIEVSLKYKTKGKRDKVLKFLDETLNLKRRTDSIQL